MKQIIVLFAMTLLGISIYGFLMGEGENTVHHSVKTVWQQQIQQQKQYP